MKHQHLPLSTSTCGTSDTNQATRNAYWRAMHKAGRA